MSGSITSVTTVFSMIDSYFYPTNYQASPSVCMVFFTLHHRACIYRDEDAASVIAWEDHIFHSAMVDSPDLN